MTASSRLEMQITKVTKIFRPIVVHTRLKSIKFPFQRYTTYRILTKKVSKNKDADVSSHVTFWACLP